jgi:hypothetical protein
MEKKGGSCFLLLECGINPWFLMFGLQIPHDDMFVHFSRSFPSGVIRSLFLFLLLFLFFLPFLFASPP